MTQVISGTQEIRQVDEQIARFSCCGTWIIIHIDDVVEVDECADVEADGGDDTEDDAPNLAGVCQGGAAMDVDEEAENEADAAEL